jgi:hypothetical protein
MIHSSTQNLYLQTSIEVVPQGWKRLYGIAFVATLIALSANLLDVILGFGETNMTAYGTMSAVAWFTLFEEDWFKGLYTLGLLNMVYTISMLPVFFAIAAAHRHTKWVYAALTVTLFFIGAAVYLSNNAAIPMFVLFQRYAVAGTDVERAMFAAAGEAVLVSGEDFTPGSFIGLILQGVAATAISVVMLRGRIFGSATAWVGIVGFTFLSMFTFWATFIPAFYLVAFYLFGMIGGLLALTWFGLVAWKFYSLMQSDAQLE